MRIRIFGEGRRGNILPRGCHKGGGSFGSHVCLGLLGGRKEVVMFIEGGRKGVGIFRLTWMSNKRREVFFSEGVGV